MIGALENVQFWIMLHRGHVKRDCSDTLLLPPASFANTGRAAHVSLL